jgi:RimJ/RimL family protein N-acetyltransferase
MIDMNILNVRTQHEDGYTYEHYEAVVGGKVIGTAGVMVSENEPQHLERIDIDDDKRGQGYGTSFIRALLSVHGRMTAAPDNQDSQRLFDRLGKDVTDAFPHLDQGYGVYEI